MERSSIFEDVQIVSQKREYSRSEKQIVLTLVGDELSQKQIDELQMRLMDYGLKNTKLVLRQAGGGVLDIGTQAQMLQRFIDQKDVVILKKDSLIERLESDLALQQERSKITTEQLAKELVSLYPQIESLTLANGLQMNLRNNTSDTIPLITMKWSSKPDSSTNVQIERWLRARLGVKRVSIINQ